MYWRAMVRRLNVWTVGRTRREALSKLIISLEARVSRTDFTVEVFPFGENEFAVTSNKAEQLKTLLHYATLQESAD